MIKTINQKHSIYLLGNNYDNYIDARGVASSYVYIFGYGGDDVLIGSQGPDNIHGHEGHDLLVGCNGTDKIYGDDGNNYLITGAGGEYIDSNDSISYGCKLSDLANDLLNSDLSKFNKVPWYSIKAKEALGLSEEEFNTLKTQSSQPQNIINQMPQSKGSNDFSIELNTYNNPVLAKKNKAIFERLLQEANNGKAFSQYNLSKMYVWGEGTNKDENKSIFWLTKSCQSPQIQNNSFTLVLITKY